MGRISKIKYSRDLGQFIGDGEEILEIEVEVGKGDDPQEAMKMAKEFVDQQANARKAMADLGSKQSAILDASSPTEEDIRKQTYGYWARNKKSNAYNWMTNVGMTPVTERKKLGKLFHQQQKIIQQMFKDITRRGKDARQEGSGQGTPTEGAGQERTP
tara:strand:- start:84 stop:557 length:474 start_codon:yes stop_codon:yes gene_type:complete